LSGTGSEAVTITLTPVRSDSTRCSVKFVVRSATPALLYTLSLGSPSSWEVTFTSSQRGTFTNSQYQVTKANLTAASKTFYLAYHPNNDINEARTALPSTSFKVADRCTA